MGCSCLGWLGGRLSFDGRRAVCWLLLSEIRAADSGTGPIHQERMRRSRFSGPCPSDVKSAVHPESAVRISLSSSTAALCPPKDRRPPSHPRQEHPIPAPGGLPCFGERVQAVNPLRRLWGKYCGVCRL